jgi:hypothetical protein
MSEAPPSGVLPQAAELEGGEVALPLAGLPQRSPEREQLARAHEAHRLAADRLRRLRQSIEVARREGIDAMLVVEQCEAILDRARREEPHRRAAIMLGEAVDDEAGPDLEEAEANLARARSDHEQAQHVISVLAAESGDQALRVADRQRQFDAAVSGVVDAELWEFEEQHRRAVARLMELENAYLALGKHLPSRSRSRVVVHIERVNAHVPRAAVEGMGAADPVKEWLAQLRSGDVDMPFPEFCAADGVD